MGNLILGALCIAGECFLIYFLVQLVRDSRRETRRLAARNAQSTSETRRFEQFELAPPTAKAVWREGRWQPAESRSLMRLSVRATHQLAGGKHRA